MKFWWILRQIFWQHWYLQALVYICCSRHSMSLNGCSTQPNFFSQNSFLLKYVSACRTNQERDTCPCNQCCQKGWHKNHQSFAKSSLKSSHTKNWFKTSLKQVLKICILDYIKLLPNLFRTGSKQVFNQFLVHFKK